MIRHTSFMTHYIRAIAIAIGLGITPVIAAAAPATVIGAATAGQASPPAAARTDSDAAGQPDTVAVAALHGVLLDASTGQPVAHAVVRLRESGRQDYSHADGSFHFDDIPAGTHTVSVERIGYAPLQRRVDVAPDRMTHLELRLVPSALQLSAVIVTGAGSERGADASYRSMTVLSDAELRRKLSGSVAATLAGEPGLTQRYNGPVAAQPVIRGLTGDRVLMLEDGQRTGDIASTSADHAVTIEPLTAERIEVVRGPAGVLYGSSSLGGVINVIREEVPRSVPESVSGTFTAQGESVNSGLTAGTALTAPVGSFAVRGELSGRTAGDTRTPQGDLPDTQLRGHNAGLGASWVGQKGHAGAAIRDFGMSYGVPGTFQGELIPGGHEGGVEIELRRTTARVEGRLLGTGGSLRSVEADANFVRFDQRELELGGVDGPVLGTHFRQYSSTANVRAHHRHAAGGVRLEGAVGASGMFRDLGMAGARTGSRPARNYSLAAFAFEEFALSPVTFELGARYDWSRVDPLDTSPSSIGDVRRRDFQSVSGSLAALYRPTDVLTTGISVSRSFRTPSIEELFSSGPHLANYSYDIGNPDLHAEYGLGIDVFVRASIPTMHAEIGFFRNAISDFIYYAPTGDMDPRLGQFPVYQAEQSDVVLRGVDGRLQWEVVRSWVIDGSLSYVRGVRADDTDGDVALPAMPPLHGALNVRRDGARVFAGLGVEGAAAQDRVAEFERPTAAYALVNATAGLRWTGFGRLNTLTLQIDNVLDTTWRDHLSRIRQVAPQPGRNIQLLYRLTI
ncbi:MAG: TonB-dependent receptor [Gemmatimonadetes bacterium]|nr:TonB-dependent receptor [Gemmatimonadota bacterium]